MNEELEKLDAELQRIQQANGARAMELAVLTWFSLHKQVLPKELMNELIATMETKYTTILASGNLR